MEPLVVVTPLVRRALAAGVFAQVILLPAEAANPGTSRFPVSVLKVVPCDGDVAPAYDVNRIGEPDDRQPSQ